MACHIAKDASTSQELGLLYTHDLISDFAAEAAGVVSPGNCGADVVILSICFLAFFYNCYQKARH